MCFIVHILFHMSLIANPARRKNQNVNKLSRKDSVIILRISERFANLDISAL